VASINKMKLPFDMGFNKIEKFFKNLIIRLSPGGQGY